VGVAGRLVPIKDHRTLFRAIAQIEGVHLAVIGDGELRGELERDAIALGIAERTHFTGWWTDMPAAFSDLDLVALSSLNEGTPVALIEALAAGRPVVATRVGGVPSVVVDGLNGVLVPAGTVGALSDAIRHLLVDRALGARLGAEGRRSVGDHFGQDRLVADIRGVYQELLAEPRSARRRGEPAEPRRRPTEVERGHRNREDDSRPLRVLALTTFPLEAAATRFRLLQLKGPLAERGITMEVDTFLDSTTFSSLYDRSELARTAAGVGRGLVRRGSSLSRSRAADVVLVQREAMLLGPPVVEWAATRLGGRPMVLDLDDATYVSYDSPTYGWMAHLLKWPGKTDALIRRASVVVCGSPPVVEHVRALGTRAVLQPTVVDTDRFLPASKKGGGAPVVGWIGSHSTYPYLQSVIPALEELARNHSFRLQVVGSGHERISVAGVEVESRPWQLDKEVTDFQTLDIGLYPTIDDGWSAGKSGLKAVQYMAVGVPFVASPTAGWVGEDAITHLTARGLDEWVSAVGRLLDDTQLRRRMGEAGRDRAIRYYSVDHAADTMTAALRGAIRGRQADLGATSTR
jgi:glycosyltransferase involved in cell wall biosynthesis